MNQASVSFTWARLSTTLLAKNSGPSEQPRNPLHGITLARMVEDLADFYGWAELGRLIPVRCFTHDPSVASSLKFLRRTPWAREKVEALYLQSLQRYGRN